MSALIELKQQGKIRAMVFLIPAPSWKKLPSTDASIAYNLLTLFSGGRWNATPCLIASRTIFQSLPSPLAQGLLTGKFERDHQFDPADNR